MSDSRLTHSVGPGVCRHHNKFKAQPCVLGRTRYCGTFDTEAEAARACRRVTQFAKYFYDIVDAAMSGDLRGKDAMDTFAQIHKHYAAMTPAERAEADKLRVEVAIRGTPLHSGAWAAAVRFEDVAARAWRAAGVVAAGRGLGRRKGARRGGPGLFDGRN